jgi:restriction endonuclease S subunit
MASARSRSSADTRADVIYGNRTSDSMRNISQENVYSIQLKLPPRNEQERIADALDELLSDLDAGVAALQSAKQSWHSIALLC